MTAAQFRKLALALPDVIESQHMSHPDFRVNGKVFASLGYPDDGFGMVKLTPEQQAHVMERAPAAFIPCAGAWGRAGCTNVKLSVARADVVRSALEWAWENVVVKYKKRGKAR